MPPRLNALAFSFKTSRRPLYRGLSLLLTLSLLACAVAAQSDQALKHAAAERLFEEGWQLAREDSKDSLEQALRRFEEAQSFFHSVNNTLRKAVTLSSIGFVYDKLGEKQKALDTFVQALSLFRAIDNRQGEANTLSRIGLTYVGLNETQKALDTFAQVLPLSRAIGDHESEALTLVGLGTIYLSSGEYQKALDTFAQALSLFRAVGDRQDEAVMLVSIGTIYSSLSEPQKALDNLAKALPVFRAIGDRRGEAGALLSIGMAYADSGEHQKALDALAQALSLSRALGNRQGEASALGSIGLVYLVSSEPQKALDTFAQALTLFRAIGDRQGEASLLGGIGFAYGRSGEYQKAFDTFAQALPLFRALGNRRMEADALGNIAVLEGIRGNLFEARAKMEAAIAIIESLRTNITNQELRASYFATAQNYYEFYIHILMYLHKERPDKGYGSVAFQTSERTRARALLEILTEAKADIRQGVEPKLVERERALQQRLNAKAQEQMKLLSSPHTDGQAKAIAQEIASLTTEFQQVETEIRQASPRYAALTQPQPLTLKEIQTQVLDADTMLLEYLLATDRSYLWVVTSSSITSYELPKRDEIEAAARRVYDLLNARNRHIEGETPAQRQARIAQADAQYVEAAASLSRMVLAPVAAQLGDKRLLIVSDGALQYIPFGALSVASGQLSVANNRTTDNYQPLIVKHEIISLPSASTINVLRREVKDRKPAAKTVAVLADPVFEDNDERVKGNSGEAAGAASRRTPRAGRRRDLPLGMERSAEESGLRGAGLEIPRLPGTRLEAEQILALVSSGERKGAFDFNASRATVTGVDLSQYRYLHFATHGFLNSLHPELSGIAFSMVDEKGNPQDGFLRAHEVFNLRLPAELVVLSACQTGLGKEVKGEGLVGLTRGFMYAGAPRVVVSLWSVSDAATAELMTRFYRGMLKDGRRPAAALREAQISLMKNRRWEQPFYWAAFTLQGEWR